MLIVNIIYLSFMIKMEGEPVFTGRWSWGHVFDQTRQRR